MKCSIRNTFCRYPLILIYISISFIILYKYILFKESDLQSNNSKISEILKNFVHLPTNLQSYHVPSTYQNHESSNIAAVVSRLSNFSNAIENMKSINHHDESPSVHIILDWTLDSDSFGYVNYKSIESLLQVYPNCFIRILLVAPEAALFYKVGNLMSRTYFQKFTKMGYNLRLELLAQRKYTPNEIQSNKHKFYGLSYWNREISKCCGLLKSNEIQFNSYHIPFHLIMYSRLMYLYLYGGLYVDFSWLHIGSLLNDIGINPSDSSSVYQGYSFHINCRDAHGKDINHGSLYHQIMKKSAPIYENATSPSDGSQCISTNLMLFSAHHPILACMLKHYDELHSEYHPFMKCVYNDNISDGMVCIEHLFQTCFPANLNTINNLFYPFKDSSPASSQESFTTTQQTHLHYQDVLWGFEKDPSNTLYSNLTSRHSPSSVTIQPVIWLGWRSYRSRWNSPIPQSLLETFIRFINSNPLYLSQSLPLEFSSKPFYIPSIPVLQSLGKAVESYENNASIFQTNTGIDIDDPSWQCIQDVATIKQSQQHCHTYHIYPNYSPVHIQQAQRSCTLHFVLPGFMKAGTSYLFDALAKHPQIIKNLRGTQFKETGCYLPDSMSKKKSSQRMNCFPFLEPHDSFYFGDGTVIYATRKEIPHFLINDNPNIKVIFSIRDPVKRTASHHRFNFKMWKSKGHTNLNHLMEIALDRSEGNLFNIYDAAVIANEERDPIRKANRVDELIQLYHRGIIGYDESRGRLYYLACNLIFHSLYFPPIYYWFQQLQRHSNNMTSFQSLSHHSNLLVVATEDMNPQKLPMVGKINWLQTYHNQMNRLDNSQEVEEIKPISKDCKDCKICQRKWIQRIQTFQNSTGLEKETVSLLDDAKYRHPGWEARALSLLAKYQSYVSTMTVSNTTASLIGTERDESYGDIELLGERPNDEMKYFAEEQGEGNQKASPAIPLMNTFPNRFEKQVNDFYLSKQLNRLYRFLNLCPWNKVTYVDIHETVDKVAPEHKLNASMSSALKKFYKPFNSLLFDFLQEDYGYNN